MAFSLGEYQDIFLEEADEQLQELNQNLLRLEKNPEDIEIINNIFRAAFVEEFRGVRWTQQSERPCPQNGKSAAGHPR